MDWVDFWNVIPRVQNCQEKINGIFEEYLPEEREGMSEKVFFRRKDLLFCEWKNEIMVWFGVRFNCVH